MSQAAAAPAPAVPAPAPVPAAPQAAPQAPGEVDTPSLLTRWQLIGMSVAIMFGILSALVQFLSWQSDGRAADDTKQLQRVQEIQSSLLHADALATNAFLVGGLENPTQRAQYDAAIADVLTKITEAAEAQPADLAVLTKLNVQVSSYYATAVGVARANNRFGNPVGAEYLSGARAQLDADQGALDILDALVAANTDRATGSMAGQHPFWLLLIGIAALGALLWLNRQLARAFRRRFNKGLAIAAAILLVVTLVAAVSALLRASSNNGLRDGEFAAAVSLAQTRTAANDAKSIESLRLIKRGNGATFEADWQAAVDQVEKGLGRAEAASDWKLYKERHAEIVTLDDGGAWDEARTLATRPDDEGSTKPFEAFDQSAKAEAAKNATATTNALDSGREIALVVSILTLLLGIAAAVAVARGIGERQREFS